LDFTQSHTLEFFAPDRERFPALDLAYAAARRGGAAPAWLSAANEVAVAAFLDDRIAWRDIVPIVATTLDSYQECDLSSIEELVLQDATARRVAHDTLPA
jgi:1-deoxy-D-xylulose-5-phosphate reductoisomerase